LKKIVVTFNVKDKQRQFIKSVVDGNADLKYLEDFTEKELPALLEDADILFVWNPPKELPGYNLKGFKKLKFVQVLSAGYDHIDFTRFPSGCKIASNKGAYARPMAEHIMAMVLALAKKLFINHKKMSEGEFNQGETNISTNDSVFGILGYGGIGKAAAKLIRPFGSKIYAVNSSGKTDEEVDYIGTLDNLNYVLQNSDIIIISLPLIRETENLISKKELELMKPDAILVNAARAQIMNEEALYNHLKAHPDFFAGIDVWWIEPFSDGEFRVNYPFFDLPNVLGSPHNSPLVPGALMEGIKKAAENINLYVSGKEPGNIVKR
jgi:glycerate dehydrogenase